MRVSQPSPRKGRGWWDSGTGGCSVPCHDIANYYFLVLAWRRRRSYGFPKVAFGLRRKKQVDGALVIGWIGLQELGQPKCSWYDNALSRMQLTYIDCMTVIVTTTSDSRILWEVSIGWPSPGLERHQVKLLHTFHPLLRNKPPGTVGTLDLWVTWQR